MLALGGPTFCLSGSGSPLPVKSALQKLRQLGVCIVIRLASSRVSKSGNGSSARFILVETDIGVFEGGFFVQCNWDKVRNGSAGLGLVTGARNILFQDVNLKTE
jgi:hypothetical protein